MIMNTKMLLEEALKRVTFERDSTPKDEPMKARDLSIAITHIEDALFRVYGAENRT